MVGVKVGDDDAALLPCMAGALGVGQHQQQTATAMAYTARHSQTATDTESREPETQPRTLSALRPPRAARTP